MSVTQITVGKSKYTIECDDSQKERLLQLANKLHKKVSNLSASMGNTDEKTILVIAALMIEADLEEKLLTKTNELKSEVSEHNLNEEDINNAISENLENVANQIDKLANKIRDY